MNFFLKKFQEVIKHGITSVFLNISYFLGIGLTACIAKARGKKFLDLYPGKSTWQKRPIKHTLEKMY